MAEAAKRNSTIYDVAGLVGVSAKTVSRVINESPKVTESTRSRVLEAIATLEYEQNPLARSLRSGRDETVGIIFESLTDPFFASLASGVQRLSQQRSTAPVLIATTDGLPGRERAIVDSLVRRQIGGIILVPLDADQSYLESIASHVPLVFVDRHGSNAVRDTVVIDDQAAAFEATTHLIAAGHTRIALIGDLDVVSSAGVRERAYRDALSVAGIAVDPELIAPCPTREAAVEAVARLLALPTPPTAIFSSNAKASLGIVPFLHFVRRTDIAIVCFGDFPMSDALNPAITVVDQDPVEMGEVAARLLFARIDGLRDEPPETLILPTRLVVRGSGEIPPRSATPQRLNPKDVI